MWRGALVIVVGLATSCGGSRHRPDTPQAPGQPERGLQLVPESVTMKALVIGNGAYRMTNASLDNPSRDAALVAEAFRDVGFAAVSVHENLGAQEMESAINAFVDTLTPEDQAVFYYAGHGIELDGQNYLLPVDFDAGNVDDAKHDAYAVERLVGRLTRDRNGMNVIILDACRNDPFSRGWTRSADSRGFAPPRFVEDTTVFWFATSPGDTAEDGEGDNSPFASALVSALNDPRADKSFIALYRRVAVDVRQRTRNRQRPWKREQLTEALFLAPVVPEEEEEAQQPVASAPRAPIATSPQAVELPASLGASACSIARLGPANTALDAFRDFTVHVGQPRSMHHYLARVGTEIDRGADEATRLEGRFRAAAPASSCASSRVAASVGIGQGYDVLARAILTVDIVIPAEEVEAAESLGTFGRDTNLLQSEGLMRDLLDQRVRPVECDAVEAYVNAVRLARRGFVATSDSRRASDRLAAYGEERIAECLTAARAQGASVDPLRPGEFASAPVSAVTSRPVQLQVAPTADSPVARAMRLVARGSWRRARSLLEGASLTDDADRYAAGALGHNQGDRNAATMWWTQPELGMPYQALAMAVRADRAGAARAVALIQRAAQEMERDDPLWGDVLLLGGVAAEAAEDFQLAMRWYEVAGGLQTPAQLQALERIAVIALTVGHAERALAVAERAVAIDAEAPMALAILSQAQLAVRQYDNALATSSRAATLATRDARVQFARGIVLWLVGDRGGGTEETLRAQNEARVTFTLAAELASASGEHRLHQDVTGYVEEAQRAIERTQRRIERDQQRAQASGTAAQ